MLRSWVLHVEGDFDVDQPLGDMYTRLTDAYIGWSPGGDLGIKLVKQSVGFTLDGATSSRSLLTMQRNDLTNNLWFTREYFTGVGVKGSVDERWRFNAGIFSSEDHDEISRFDAGLFGLLSVGYEMGGPGVDDGLIRVDFVYNDEDPDAGTREFSRVLSLVTKWRAGPFGLWSDLSGGRGYGAQSDLWGAVLMPFYDLSSRFQAVLRLTFVASTGENGVRLPRYPARIVDGRGDEYREIYLGFNVYLYGHKLKWQTGIEYGTMRDTAVGGGEYSGWGLNTGLRISW